MREALNVILQQDMLYSQASGHLTSFQMALHRELPGTSSENGYIRPQVLSRRQGHVCAAGIQHLGVSSHDALLLSHMRLVLSIDEKVPPCQGMWTA